MAHECGTVESRRRLGYLPENPALYEFLRGDEYLVFAGKLSGLSAAEASALAVRESMPSSRAAVLLATRRI